MVTEKEVSRKSWLIHLVLEILNYLNNEEVEFGSLRSFVEI